MIATGSFHKQQVPLYGKYQSTTVIYTLKHEGYIITHILDLKLHWDITSAINHWSISSRLTIAFLFTPLILACFYFHSLNLHGFESVHLSRVSAFQPSALGVGV